MKNIYYTNCQICYNKYGKRVFTSRYKTEITKREMSFTVVPDNLEHNMESLINKNAFILYRTILVF